MFSKYKNKDTEIVIINNFYINLHILALLLRSFHNSQITLRFLNLLFQLCSLKLMAIGKFKLIQHMLIA